MSTTHTAVTVIGVEVDPDKILISSKKRVRGCKHAMPKGKESKFCPECGKRIWESKKKKRVIDGWQDDYDSLLKDGDWTSLYSPKLFGEDVYCYFDGDELLGVLVGFICQAGSYRKKYGDEAGHKEEHEEDNDEKDNHGKEDDDNDDCYCVKKTPDINALKKRLKEKLEPAGLYDENSFGVYTILEIG